MERQTHCYVNYSYQHLPSVICKCVSGNVFSRKTKTGVKCTTVGEYLACSCFFRLTTYGSIATAAAPCGSPLFFAARL